MAIRVLLIIILCTGVLYAQSTSVPAISPQELADKTAQVKELVASAKTPADKKELALKLFKIAQDEPDFSVKSMMLSWVKEMFSLSGSAMKPQESRDMAREMAQNIIKMVDAALVQNDFKAARQFGSTLTYFSNASHDADTDKIAIAKIREVQELEIAFGAVKAAMDKLSKEENDASANHVVGRYYAFIKGDWPKGLPMLAKSIDETVNACAKLELSAPAETAKMLELADGWWKVAEKEKGVAQEHVRQHATGIYGPIVEKLTGLDKARAEKRMESGNPLLEKLTGTKWKFLHANGTKTRIIKFGPNGKIVEGAASTERTYRLTPDGALETLDENGKVWMHFVYDSSKNQWTNTKDPKPGYKAAVLTPGSS